MISVIVPVYRESPTLVFSTIEHLIGFKGVSEIIIVTTHPDPLAADIKKMISTHYANDSQLISTVADHAGRARQMNQGATRAKSDSLLFIHADTRLPDAADDYIKVSLKSADWGRFDVKLDDQRLVYRVISWFINKRSGLTHICTGDQALFMTHDFFKNAGGFPEQELMEDVEFSIRAKNISLPAVIKKPVITSARRWQQNGVIKTIILMWCLRALYWFGMPVLKLARLYRQVR